LKRKGIAIALPVGGLALLETNKDVFGISDVDLVEDVVFFSLINLLSS